MNCSREMWLGIFGWSGVDDGGVNGILADLVWSSYNKKGGCVRERKDVSIGSQTRKLSDYSYGCCRRGRAEAIVRRRTKGARYNVKSCWA
jgi:hypothetical protein